MVRIELCPKRPGRVGVNFIFDNCSILSARNPPAAFIHLAHIECSAGGGSHPVHVLRKVAHLIQSVPHWQLQMLFGGARRYSQRDMKQMLLGAEKRNGVEDWPRNASLFKTLRCSV